MFYVMFCSRRSVKSARFKIGKYTVCSMTVPYHPCPKHAVCTESRVLNSVLSHVLSCEPPELMFAHQSLLMHTGWQTRTQQQFVFKIPLRVMSLNGATVCCCVRTDHMTVTRWPLITMTAGWPSSELLVEKICRWKLMGKTNQNRSPTERWQENTARFKILLSAVGRLKDLYENMGLNLKKENL